MSKFTSLIRRAPKRFSAVVAIVAAAIIVPLAVHAYGPERPTFTYANPAPYVTFNSITDNPNVGDERNFVRIKEDSTSTTYTDSATLVPGKTYQVEVYYHNNAASNLNASGKGIAKDVSLRMQMPATIAAKGSDTVDGFINSSNANPTSVWDSATLKNGSDGAVAIRYVAGSAKVTSNGAVNGATLPDAFLTSGTPLGYDKLDGTLPGCNQYAGYVTYKFTVEQPNFSVEKTVSVDGGKTFAKTGKTTLGSTVVYKVAYTNTGSTQQDNVTLSDKLPSYVSYVPGSALIANSKTNGYEKTSDGITTTGLNIGSYAPGGNAYFKFSAKVTSSDAYLQCGTNTLTNTARATTSGGYKESTADITIEKDCTPPPTQITVCELATKKIVTINESDFNTTKYSKNLDDCKTVVNITVCELATKKIVTIDETKFDATKYSKDLNDCKEVPPVQITVCELATKKIVTINESAYDTTKYSKNLDDCKTTPTTINVCELATKKIVNINESDFDTTKYSKNLDDCKTPVTINVCELATKQIVNIDEANFDATKYSKDLNDCKETPPVTITVCDLSTKKTVTINESDFDSTKYSKDLNACATPTTPPELPHTGMSENIVAVVGLGALIASIGYYVASRRALNQ